MLPDNVEKYICATDVHFQNRVNCKTYETKYDAWLHVLNLNIMRGLGFEAVGKNALLNYPRCGSA